MSLESIIAELRTDSQAGLAREERRHRQQKVGLNLLEARKKKKPIMFFLSQFGDTMVLMLLAATLVSAIMGEFADSLTIMIIVVLNAFLGFFQEYKAERSLEALQNLNSPKAQILSGGEVKSVPAQELVPGDIVFLRAGDRVPADLHIFNSHSLEVEESPLTGETVPVPKSEDAPGDEAYAYMGCLVTRGQSMAVVVATGMATKMGKIADLIQEAEQPPTPLQQRLAKLGNILVALCLIICVLVVVAGTLRGEALYKMFMAGVSLAVAAIPEGLPAVVTLCLAIGLQRMLRRKAIARKLPAVETLGCATVICSDKTGTLTKNQMTVEKLYTSSTVLGVTGKGYSLEGEVVPQGKYPRGLEWMLTVGVMCNGAKLQKGQGKRAGIHGDPTDGALLVLAAKKGLYREKLREHFQILQEYPFDSNKKMMTTVVRDFRDGTVYSMVKGAPEVVLPLCSSISQNGSAMVMDGTRRREIDEISLKWAGQAYRLLAIAWKSSPSIFTSRTQAEVGLVFGGIVALNDPPRPQVPEAVRQCLQAGVRPVMITGDHRATAVAIAKRIGLPLQDVITGAEMEKMSDVELQRRVDSISVYARVYPEHKMRIVRALKKQGHVVAMTGDGVNDAPAVKEANIGISMGISGTEVTKEAASLVLADDNFATIVAAVEEGRVIYSNIRKFIRFLLACNTGEVLTMFFAMLLGFPLPLLAIQILWVNLVTDGLPALALSMEPASPGIMQRPPRAQEESIFARGLGISIFSTGLLFGVVTLLAFVLGLATGAGLDYARTMALTTLISIQLIFALDCRKDSSGHAAPLMANLWIVGAVVASFGLLCLVLYVPMLQKIFSTMPLNALDWALVLGFSFLPAILRKVIALVKPAGL